MSNNNKEIDLINDFIDNFNPDEFSSSDNFKYASTPNLKDIKRARKLKARINRKHRMKDFFEHVLETKIVVDTDVCISQEQIDALLASA